MKTFDFSKYVLTILMKTGPQPLAASSLFVAGLARIRSGTFNIGFDDFTESRKDIFPIHPHRVLSGLLEAYAIVW